jgi:ABC-type lipoprotein release transport system permease subunit
MIPSALRLGWRNLGRNRKRTALAVGAIAVAQCVLLLWDGLLTGYLDMMVKSITGPLMGHVHVSAPGWLDDRAMEKALADAPGLLAAIRADPDVAFACPRLTAPALVAAGEDGEGAMILGLDLDLETGADGLLAGLAAAERPGPGEALLGASLAEGLGAKRGTRLAVMGQAADGSVAASLFTIKGIVASRSEPVNRFGVLVSLPEAQELFVLPGAVHEIVVQARRSPQSENLAARLAALPALRGAEVKSWRAVAPEIAAIVDLLGAYELFMLFLVFIAAAAGVANTLMMSTFERIHELGMLLALGAKPGRIVRMVLAEAVVLGLLGAAVGTVLGMALVGYWAKEGLDLSALAGKADSQVAFAGMRVSWRIFPVFEWAQAAQGFAAVFVTSLVASAWPAARAARLEPMEAMRQ